MYKNFLNTLLLVCITVMANAQAVGTTGVTATTLPALANADAASSFNRSVYNGGVQKIFNNADLTSKEISKEVAAPKNGDIYIENSSRGIVVKTWDQQKVKVTTTIYYDGDSKLSDDEWLEKVNLSLKTVGGSVKIKSGTVGGSSMYYFSDAQGSYNSSNGGTAVFNASGENIGTKNNVKRIVTITVPAGSKLDIESKYADISLAATINDLNLDITNGNLEAENLQKLILRSKYSNINVGDVRSAEIELTNGRFNAKNVDDLDIDSKYSTIEMATAKKIIMRSTNDEYEFEEVGEISGRKNYGNLRITKLNNSIELEGSSADIKIRNVAASVNLIKINDKYADIRIPLKNNKNFSVDFSGAYSSVYGNFEKKSLVSNVEDNSPRLAVAGSPIPPNDRAPAPKVVTGQLYATNVVRDTAVAPVKNTRTTTASAGTGYTTTLTGSAAAAPQYEVVSDQKVVSDQRVGTLGTLTTIGRYNNSYSGNNDTPSKFTASVGDGKALKIELKCQNCTIDFK